MEMKDSALQNLMATQNSILEEIKELRKREELQKALMSPSIIPEAKPMIPENIQLPPIQQPNVQTFSADMVNAPAIPPPPPIEHQPYAPPVIQPPPIDHHAPLIDTSKEINEIAKENSNKDNEAINELAKKINEKTTQFMPKMPWETFDANKPLSYANVAAMSTLPRLKNDGTFDLNKGFNDLIKKETATMKETATGVLEDFATLNITKMSKEQLSQHLAQSTLGMQELGSEALGGAVGLGSSAAAFFAPMGIGLGVGVAGGLAADAIIKGSKAANDYQEILLNDGYKAFNALESTGDFGAIGVGHEDRQSLSKTMRHIATDSFLEDEEVAAILQGSLDYKLMKSTQDVETFSNKFKAIVDTTRKITTTLGMSIDEAIAFMGEMDARGVSMKDMTSVAAQGKVGASFAGQDTNSYTESMLQFADNITANTTIGTENITQGIGFASYAIDAIDTVSKEGDGLLTQLIKNSGGATNVAGQMETKMSDYLRGEGSSHLLGMFGAAYELDEEGKWSFNANKFDELKEMDYYDLLNSSQEHFRQYTPAQLDSLQKQAGVIATRDTDYAERYDILNTVVDSMVDTNPTMTREAVLSNLNLVSEDNPEMARLMSEMLTIATDDNATKQYDALTLNEEIVSANNLESPGFYTRAKTWVKKVAGQPLGDLGQGFSDSVGDLSHGINKRLSGMTDAQKNDLDADIGLTEEDFEQRFDGIGERYELLSELTGEEITNTDTKTTTKTKNRMTSDELARALERARAGDLSFAEQDEFKEMLESDDISWRHRQQIEHVLKNADGETNRSPFMWATTMFAKDKSYAAEAEGESFSSREKIEELQEQLKEEMPQARGELSKMVLDSNLSVDKKSKLDQLIKEEDYEGAMSLVGKNSDIGKQIDKISGLENKAMQLQEAEFSYLGDVKSVENLMNTTGDLYGILHASGVYDEETYQKYYGSDSKAMRNAIERDVDDLEGMSDAALKATADNYLKEGKKIFSERSQTELAGIAEHLASSVGGMNIEDLMNERGEYDSEKLYNEVMNIMKTSSTSDNAAIAALKGEEGESTTSSASNKELKSVLESHEKTLDTMTRTMTEEISILNEAVAELQRIQDKRVTGR